MKSLAKQCLKERRRYVTDLLHLDVQFRNLKRAEILKSIFSLFSHWLRMGLGKERYTQVFYLGGGREMNLSLVSCQMYKLVTLVML